MKTLAVWAMLGLLPAVAAGQDMVIVPEEPVLSGPRAGVQLVVVQAREGRATGDVGEGVLYTSSDEKIATVDQQGWVRARGNGLAVITARAGRRSAEIKVRVVHHDKPFAWNFTNHIQPVLTRTGCNMGACHGALAGKGGFKLSLRGYDADADHFAITRQALGRRTDLAEPESSLLLRKATRGLPHGGGTRFHREDEAYTIIREWIAEGAPGPQPTDPKLTRLEVFPRSALLQPKDRLRVSVRAHYSDGRSDDVTRWAKFVSSEEPVASVDEDGAISVAGPGETAVSAIFAGRVATLTVTVPFPNTIDPAMYALPRGANLIDEQVHRKLQLLRIPLSGPTRDEEFLRRAYLDTCGVLPRPDEIRAFLVDTSPTKREAWIDRLLARSEFVDYWSHKWSDLFLVSSRKLSQPSMWGFYRRIRSAVADNQPWDQFTRDILTASGSTLTNGGGNYFALHKDTAERVESTAVTFLGVSITCARCHNHPLEKWTQDQYWAMANLFSRVGIKSGERAGELFVQSVTVGEALHPRRGTALPPTPLDGKPLALDSTRDRREYFAEWLTAADNPFFARAIVNRVWKNFMGRGLVEADDDLRDTNPATNPELLDALAKTFVIDNYDMKKLMRRILTSAAYQRSSQPVRGNEADDRFYSRYLPRRLSAEVILDAYSDISGVPTTFNAITIGSSGGNQKTEAYPAGTRAMQLPDSQLVSAFLDNFGRAERQLTCSCEVNRESSVTQALHLSNGQTLNEKLRQPNSIVDTWLKERIGDAEIVDRLFMLALSRSPTATERKKFIAALSEAGPGAKERREAIEDVVWAVLSGKEFLFNR